MPHSGIYTMELIVISENKLKVMLTAEKVVAMTVASRLE